MSNHAIDSIQQIGPWYDIHVHVFGSWPNYIWLMFLQVEVHLQYHLNMVETRIGFSLVGLIEIKESLKK